MVDIISIVLLAYVLFVPGFLLTWILFREVGPLERALLSVTFSVMIIVAIGVSLGYNATVAQKTGGITPSTVWMVELSVSLLLGLVALAVNRKELKQLSFRSGSDFRPKRPQKKQVEPTRLQ